ncbi:hypothetical protein [Rhodoblastus acidophilus]|uniref:hypothetical protein n=1 Tax=Rhodoblastus acidophilus TaxID=1074 RepID=UPI001FCE95D2|nr:hypothetical protein [Rhodoblastus acidophilus]
MGQRDGAASQRQQRGGETASNRTVCGGDADEQKQSSDARMQQKRPPQRGHCGVGRRDLLALVFNNCSGENPQGDDIGGDTPRRRIFAIAGDLRVRLLIGEESQIAPDGSKQIPQLQGAGDFLGLAARVFKQFRFLVDPSDIEPERFFDILSAGLRQSDPFGQVFPRSFIQQQGVHIRLDPGDD